MLSASCSKQQEEPSGACRLDLRDTSAISTLGQLARDPEIDATLQTLLLQSPVSRLSRAIQIVVTYVRAANPRTLTMHPGWFSRFTGAALERNVAYQLAHLKLDRQLDAANAIAGEMQGLFDRLRQVHHSTGEKVAYLDACLEAGNQALEHYDPRATGDEVPPSAMERLSRRLTHLATLRMSLQLTQAQLNPSIELATAHLDRFYQVRDILIPVWRQHTLSLLTNDNHHPDRMAAASKAHDQLMQSLSALSNPKLAV